MFAGVQFFKETFKSPLYVSYFLEELLIANL